MKLPQQWTAQSAALALSRGYRHFRVVGEQGKGPSRALEIEAILNRAVRLVVPLQHLRDRGLWQPGWQSLSTPAVMQIIPAIDLLDGHCVRLHQGDYGQVTRFSDDPVAQALDWQRQGAQRLHLVDLDGAKTGQPVNDQVVKAITAALSIPVQLGGGVRSAERAEELLRCGLDRVILGTVAIEQPTLVSELAARYPGKVVVGIDAKDGMVATRGWIETSTVKATELAKRFEGTGVAAIISTDIATDGTLAGPNLEALRAMAEASSIPVIASGGIGTLEDILSLLAIAPLGVTGVIVGRALYDGTVDLAEALQAIGPERLQDALTSPTGSITV
ncbi:MAG: 1-(5-phosphoribosyl)-5-[(5-phosphoribosylamino)methylideneamino]imidazole-4-carboxamide isomerase [Cyanobacteria bacterium M_surface_10_m1_298]|nr:1-(5-phosphoribosyl)-5-[(5-phosphoribosylamino)methylideneamino]imidazole-4-carboxamide isomerase [Cyanobacteria bacterium M_surface_10_m1_298]